MKRTFALGILAALTISLSSPATATAQEQELGSTEAWLRGSSAWLMPEGWLYNPLGTLLGPIALPFISLFLSTDEDRLEPFWGSSDIPGS